MKKPPSILFLSIVVASCKSPEEKAWDKKTMNDASKMKKVLDSGVSPNLEVGTASKSFLLQAATEMHRVNTVKVLLDRGADPNKKSWGTEKSCLFLAAYGGNLN